MDNNFLLEENNAKVAFGPVDMNAAAITGARIKMDEAKRCSVVINMGTSALPAVVQFTLKQHNAAAAGTSKVLAVANKYYVKSGAAIAFTQVDPGDVAASLYDLSTTFTADDGLVVFEVLDSDLDVNNGFAWFSVDVAISTAAKLAGAVYISDAIHQPAYSNDI
jgi:hypothetical protein